MAKLRIFQHINALASRQVYLPLYFYDFLHKMLRCLSNNSLPFRSSSPRGHKRLLTRCGTREPSTRRSSTNCAANIGNRERAIRYTTYSHGNETLNFHQSYRRSHSPPLTLLFPLPQPLPFPGAGRAAKRNSPPLTLLFPLPQPLPLPGAGRAAKRREVYSFCHNISQHQNSS